MKPSIFLNELIDLKHMETLEKMPFEAQHKIFKRLAEIADSKTLTKEEQEKYDNSMMVMWDNYAVYKHAEEKGIIKGEAKGRAEGRAEGKAEGRAEEKSDIARKMMECGMDMEQISQITGLSLEQIKKL